MKIAVVEKMGWEGRKFHKPKWTPAFYSLFRVAVSNIRKQQRYCHL